MLYMWVEWAQGDSLETEQVKRKTPLLALASTRPPPLLVAYGGDMVLPAHLQALDQENEDEWGRATHGRRCKSRLVSIVCKLLLYCSISLSHQSALGMNNSGYALRALPDETRNHKRRRDTTEIVAELQNIRLSRHLIPSHAVQRVSVNP